MMKARAFCFGELGFLPTAVVRFLCNTAWFTETTYFAEGLICGAWGCVCRVILPVTRFSSPVLKRWGEECWYLSIHTVNTTSGGTGSKSHRVSHRFEKKPLIILICLVVNAEILLKKLITLAACIKCRKHGWAMHFFCWGKRKPAI